MKRCRHHQEQKHSNSNSYGNVTGRKDAYPHRIRKFRAGGGALRTCWTPSAIFFRESSCSSLIAWSKACGQTTGSTGPKPEHGESTRVKELDVRLKQHRDKENISQVVLHCKSPGSQVVLSESEGARFRRRCRCMCMKCQIYEQQGGAARPLRVHPCVPRGGDAWQALKI